MFQILHLVSFNIYDNIKYNNFIFSSICIIFHQKQLPTHYNNTPFQASKNFQWYNLRNQIDSLSIILCRKSSYNRLQLQRVLKHKNEKKHVLEQPCPSKKNIKKLNTNIFMHTLFSLFQISDRNRDNVRSYKESCQLAFAKRIRHVSKEMAKIIILKIF